MKKLIISFLAIILSQLTIAQPLGILEFNNVKTQIHGDGILFNDRANHEPSFEVPKGTGADVIYLASLWLTGVNNSNAMVMSSSIQYETEELVSYGPIASQYDSAYLKMYNRVWVMTKDKAEKHRYEWSYKDYVMPEGIRSWPGNGKVSNGEAQQLAPFADRNGNGIYEPELGDYPCIEGDQAIYVIYNDVRGRDEVKNGPSMNLEIHLMAYQYAENNEVNNTVYLKYKVYNRSSNTYNDFRMGMFADIDVGCSLDDYIGCDTSSNTFYGYNGDAFDEDCNGQVGYKANRPAVGFTFLNRELDGYISFQNGTGPFGDPVTPAEFHSYMNSRWRDGSPLTYGDGGFGGTTPTKFMYPGDPNDTSQWNEGFFPVGDRKVVGSAAPFTFAPNSSESFDIAVNFSLSIDTVQEYPSVTTLLNSVNVVRDHYNNTTNACDLYVGVADLEVNNKLVFYPNPVNKELKIRMNSKEVLSVQIFNNLGVEVLSVDSVKDDIDVSNLSEGVYLVQATISDVTEVHRIVVAR